MTECERSTVVLQHHFTRDTIANMSLLSRVRRLQAQLEVAKRALWHYSKGTSWYSCKGESNHFQVWENQQYGEVTTGPQIAQNALDQIQEIEQASPLKDHEVKPWKPRGQ